MILLEMYVMYLTLKNNYLRLKCCYSKDAYFVLYQIYKMANLGSWKLLIQSSQTYSSSLNKGNHDCDGVWISDLT